MASPLKRLLDRDTSAVASKISGLVAAQAAIAAAGTTDGNLTRVEDRFLELAALMTALMFLADLSGRKQVLEEARRAGALIPRSNIHIGVPERIRFPVSENSQETEARKILGSEPTLAIKATEIAKVYQEHGLAAARSARIETTKAVQSSITRMVQRHEDEIDARGIVSDLSGWIDQYASVAHGSNTTTAYTAGQFAEARSTTIRNVAGAFRLIIVDDAVVRRGRPEDQGENHKAGFGLVAGFGDPVWLLAAPPSGFRCRCTLELVPWRELRALGLMVDGRVVKFEPPGFEQFRAHPRFQGHRPDEQIYGSDPV